jgi:hypothetical protein
VADSLADFCNLVVSLFKSKELVSDVGLRGMRYIEFNHIWEVLNARFAFACRANMNNGEWL